MSDDSGARMDEAILTLVMVLVILGAARSYPSLGSSWDAMYLPQPMNVPFVSFTFGYAKWVFLMVVIMKPHFHGSAQNNRFLIKFKGDTEFFQEIDPEKTIRAEF